MCLFGRADIIEVSVAALARRIWTLENLRMTNCTSVEKKVCMKMLWAAKKYIEAIIATQSRESEQTIDRSSTFQLAINSRIILWKC